MVSEPLPAVTALQLMTGKGEEAEEQAAAAVRRRLPPRCGHGCRSEKKKRGGRPRTAAGIAFAGRPNPFPGRRRDGEATAAAAWAASIRMPMGRGTAGKDPAAGGPPPVAKGYPKPLSRPPEGQDGPAPPHARQAQGKGAGLRMAP